MVNKSAKIEHLNEGEKSDIISCQCSCSKDDANQIAEIIDYFSFMMLNDLADAIRTIAKGRR